MGKGLEHRRDKHEKTGAGGPRLTWGCRNMYLDEGFGVYSVTRARFVATRKESLATSGVNRHISLREST